MQVHSAIATLIEALRRSQEQVAALEAERRSLRLDREACIDRLNGRITARDVEGVPDDAYVGFG